MQAVQRLLWTWGVQGLIESRFIVCLLSLKVLCFCRELSDRPITFHVAGVCPYLLRVVGLLLLPAIPQRS